VLPRRRPTTARAAAAPIDNPPPVILFSIDIGEGALVRDLEIAGGGRVRPHDWLRALGRIRASQRGEERPIDEQRMAVPRA
jgi:hypothetical protein